MRAPVLSHPDSRETRRTVMKSSIYDILRGSFRYENRPQHPLPEQHRRILSIVENLDRLFNTRRGTIQHMADYGLPTISEIYRDLPESIPHLESAIRLAVETYEPRLTNVRVRHCQKPDRSFGLTLAFILSADVAGKHAIQFKTTFQSEANPTADISHIARVTPA